MHATSRLAVAFRAVTIAAVGLLAIAPLTTVPAAAKTCKDIITAHARSSAQVSDETREKRARDKAISNWGKRAADTYGWAYRFWYRAEEQKVECKGTEKSRSCSVAAKPCTVY
jgi:hypothetical protein